MTDEIRLYVIASITPLKDAIFDIRKNQHELEEKIRAISDINNTDLEIRQIETDRAITDLEIRVHEILQK